MLNNSNPEASCSESAQAAPRYRAAGEERLALKTFVKLVRCCEAVVARTQPGIADAGLTPSQFAVLEVLYSLGPLCQKAIGEKILKTSGNITMVIDNLERNGLVQRVRSEEDRRYIRVHLTEAGHAVIHGMFPNHVHEITSAMGALSPEEQETLGKLCRKLGKNLPE